jgi:hypothetical protein
MQLVPEALPQLESLLDEHAITDREHRHGENREPAPPR